MRPHRDERPPERADRGSHPAAQPLLPLVGRGDGWCSSPHAVSIGDMTLAPARPALAEVVDLDRYPLDDLDGPRGAAMVGFCRASLAFEGACRLPGFLRPDAVRRLVEETGRTRAQAYRTDATHNVYFEDVPADGADELYRYADPLGAASLMVFDDGDELGWHFDRSPFAVTLMLQPALDGGAFEYHQDLRGADDPDRVRAALAGELDGRITLVDEPGTLTVFRGRNSLHRVTPVGGGRPRINAVLAYSARPDDAMNRLTREMFYGRA